MVKKKKTAASAAPATRAAALGSRHSKTNPSKASGAASLDAGAWVMVLMALMFFFMPALGVPHEEMLQDTLKSAVASFFALGAMVFYLWRERARSENLRWHLMMWFPVLVCAYALVSMGWAHNAYLPGVEAIRWFIFGVLLWLGLNAMTRERFDILALGIHAGGVAAALWGLMQFWFDLKLFPQGPNPASTFVNRNFAAEFIVTMTPYSVYLLFRMKNATAVCLMAFSLALNMLFVLACGTRAALIAFSLTSVPMAVGLAIFRSQLQWLQWSRNLRAVALGIFACTVLGLGMVSAGNSAEELHGRNALNRTFVRAQSLGGVATEDSFGMRKTMWAATVRMIQARPLSGVGAGVWEVDQPLYQTEGSQLETDYYVHNEFLQHIAEYGLMGWITIVGLVAYLALSAWRTFRDRNESWGQSEGLVRMIALCSLFALFVVSNAGFPWRMATTCALFAAGLAVVAASDVRMGYNGWLRGASTLPVRTWALQGAWAVFVLCTVLAMYITQQAVVCEQKIVRAVKLSLGISQSGNPNHPQWNRTKGEIVQLLREGVAINPHYRKITPVAADEFARWGDWKTAIWLWESVLSSRPYIVAIMSNVTKGYAGLREYDKGMVWLQRMQAIQPKAVAVRSVEVILLSNTGRSDEARRLSRQYMAEGTVDADLAMNAYRFAMVDKDYPMALDALVWRRKLVPAETVTTLLKAGEILMLMGRAEEGLDHFRLAISMAPEVQKADVKAQVPLAYQGKL